MNMEIQEANRADNHLHDDPEDGSQVAQVPASSEAAVATANFVARTRIATVEFFDQCSADNEPDDGTAHV
jgi:hypothetical protein